MRTGPERKAPIPGEFTNRLSLFGGCHADESAVSTSIAKMNDAVDLCEESMVSSHANVSTGMKPGSALTNQNRATGHELPGKPLHAEHLGIRVAAVPR